MHGTFWKRLQLSSLPPPQFGLRSNNREGMQPSKSTKNCIKDLLSMVLPIRTRCSFPLSQSLPSGSFHKPPILLNQRADRMKTIITENYPISSHGPHCTNIGCCSVTQSCLTLWPHGLQHTRLPCLSPSPGVCSNSCPLNWWCDPTISSSFIPFHLFCLQSFPASESFPMSWLFVSSDHSVWSFSISPSN